MIFNHTLHKELWLWLSEHPGREKIEWPGWKKHGNAKYNCFACEAVKGHVRGCIDCPLRWGTSHCTNHDSIYNEWIELTDSLLYEITQEDWDKCKERLTKLALQIANLPLREIEGMEVI